MKNNTAQPIETNSDGFWKRADGVFVPLSMVKEVDQLKDDLVRQLITSALPLSGMLEHFRRQAITEVCVFRQLSAEEHGVKLRGTGGNVELVTFDGRYKVKMAENKTMTFDHLLLEAKALIDECLNEWTAGGRDEVRVIIHDAFRVDSTGSVSFERISGLTKLAISDDRWQRAMALIGESQQVQSSKTYLRLYERDDATNEYQQIPLDCSKFGG